MALHRPLLVVVATLAHRQHHAVGEHHDAVLLRVEHRRPDPGHVGAARGDDPRRQCHPGDLGAATVSVDNAVLKAQDVQAVSNGAAGKVNAGDRVVLTYSTLVSPTTIKAGWNGAPIPVAVTLKDATVAGTGTGTDRMDTDAKPGHVTFGQDCLKKGRSTTLLSSTMTATTATVATESGASDKDL